MHTLIVYRLVSFRLGPLVQAADRQDSLARPRLVFGKHGVVRDSSFAKANARSGVLDIPFVDALQAQFILI